MTEYKLSWLSLVNHLPILLFEGILVFGSTQIANSKWVWITATSLILLVTLTLILINEKRRYLLHPDKIILTGINGHNKTYLFDDVTFVKYHRFSMELGVKMNHHIKTVYLGWYIKDYSQLKESLLENLKSVRHYDRIIFIK